VNREAGWNVLLPEPSQENNVTQQQSAYPLDYTKGPGAAGSQKECEAVQGTMDRTKDAAADAQEIGSKVREYGERAQDAARNFKPYVEKSMKEKPVATLAVASVIGFVLGALWKK